ncbi:MAG: undecaprenyl-diphosphate phosphatase [Myxococcales bacterium]|nr:undecaprenyl-diphosphate phosphatase [Myxococcales bacterium]
MELRDAVLLGLIEGLTELLPVSSTGHLILLGSYLRHEGDAAKALDVVIQLGAVLAIALYFRRRLQTEFRGLVLRRPESIRLVSSLAAAFVPTAAVGLMVNRFVKEHLFAPIPVAFALAVGGIAMLAVERRTTAKEPREGLAHLGPREGFIIGLFQCLALWPGASRSMTTIVGARLLGLGNSTAAEFSFLLALPTLGAATAYDFVRHGRLILDMPGGPEALLVGTLVSFLVTLLVIALFLRYVSKVGLAPFAIYRLLLSAAVLWFCL